MGPGEGPKIAIVGSQEVAAQHGILDARYWTDRRDGETWERWVIRREIEHLEELARWHQDQADARLAEAAKLWEGTA